MLREDLPRIWNLESGLILQVFSRGGKRRTRLLQPCYTIARMPLNFIEDELASLLQGQENGTVVITIDKDAPTQYLVNVAGIASKLKAKTVISVSPE